MRSAMRLVLAVLVAAIGALAPGCGADADEGAPGNNGGGSSGPECTGPEGCPAPENQCEVAVCNAGVCGAAPADDGTELWTQVVGDCQMVVCDGSGATRTVPDDSDAMNDGDDCTMDGCAGGMRTTEPAPARTSCDDGGGALCDAMGRCVECIDEGDCAAGTCAMGVCQRP